MTRMSGSGTRETGDDGSQDCRARIAQCLAGDC